MAFPSRSCKLLIQMDRYATKYKIRQSTHIDRDAGRVLWACMEGRIWEGLMKEANCYASKDIQDINTEREKERSIAHQRYNLSRDTMT